MFRQLNSLTKLTTSSIKYAANNTASFVGLSQSIEDLPTPQITAYWINETQRGLEAFFNDEFGSAQAIFIQHNEESPFHAVGYALMTYVEAILGFETEKIQTALERITAAELLARQFIKRVRRKTGELNSTRKTAETQYELLAANCILMASTLQFLKNSWLDYMKAVYKLRKAYKLYDQMFETLTGQRASEYAVDLKRIPQERRLSLFTYQARRKNEKALLRNSCLDESRDSIDNAIESGIFFGIGLFSLVFSLLPPKVNKILNTLGFQSSRPFALDLLQKSFKNLGLYSSLSALSLLAYYTNLSLFIHPQLLPNSLSLVRAREILDQMKQCFPRGKIWKLLEGKLCKMEGRTRRGVEILQEARCRESVLTGKLQAPKKEERMGCELAQLKALAVYEMGWGQIFLGDYFQASETFFRLEGMNNWSRAFYHYIATCCMFADEAYEKSALEFMQIPAILRRKKQMGAKLLPNEIFAERKIKHWRSRVSDNEECMLNGSSLKIAVVINPLWELIYLWNGFSQLSPSRLESMKNSMHNILMTKKHGIGSDITQLYLLFAVCIRELGDYDQAEKYLSLAIKSDDGTSKDKWVLPHAYYEMAALNCFRLLSQKETSNKQNQLKNAEDWIQKCEIQLSQRNNTENPNDSVASDGDSDWDGRLHVRCQLLIEKLDDFNCL